MSEGLLLDTCAMIWMAHGEAVASDAKQELVRVRSAGGVIAVSAMSAWEIGMLVARGRLPTTKTALMWFDDVVRLGNLNVAEATPEVLIASSYLPAPVHNDPTDRIIIATAREHDLTIITRDRAILAYGAAGHVKTLVC
ncbi:twitching motility protein PilT [Rhizobium sp. Root1203]|jgi:PIN domain nuclease of toxin-antitoxin system|uniref:type II toxin-antitoxin system VapC family toxin n=1 Tax=Rhizobium sp. Root1203 TaxID=1736427 RepID=UPI00070B2FF3|nr:PIN domain-containing protein [Rhizobium sp. Root1203]KQV28366.1 twitching motility protein PilT [Rhizobium sp. Root1203]